MSNNKGGSNTPKKGEQGFQPSKAGKKAPTVGRTAELKKPLATTQTVAAAQTPYPSLRTGRDLDWQQDYEDYLFGIQDIWDALDKGLEPDVDVKRYFEDKATAVDKNEFGMKVLLGDLESFKESGVAHATVPYTILLRVLTKQAEADIREHKPVYDLGEITTRNEFGGMDFLYCSVCVDMSYPCPTVQSTHLLDELDPYLMNKVRSEMFNQAVSEGEKNWDSQA